MARCVIGGKTLLDALDDGAAPALAFRAEVSLVQPVGVPALLPGRDTFLDIGWSVAHSEHSKWTLRGLHHEWRGFERACPYALREVAALSLLEREAPTAGPKRDWQSLDVRGQPQSLHSGSTLARPQPQLRDD